MLLAICHSSVNLTPAQGIGGSRMKYKPVFCIAASSKSLEVSRWMSIEGVASIAEAKMFLEKAVEEVDPPEHLKTLLVGVRYRGVTHVVTYRDGFGPWNDVLDIPSHMLSKEVGDE